MIKKYFISIITIIILLINAIMPTVFAVNEEIQNYQSVNIQSSIEELDTNIKQNNENDKSDKNDENTEENSENEEENKEVIEKEITEVEDKKDEGTEQKPEQELVSNDNKTYQVQNPISQITDLSNGQLIENGIYTIQTALDEQKLLEISGGSQVNGGNLQIWNKTNSKAQQFSITYLNDGMYKIEAVHSGKVLDVANGSKFNGTNVQQYESNNSNAQQWIIRDEGNGYYSIISKCNGLYIDISGGSSANGTNVQVYEGNGSQSQKFKFTEVEQFKGTKTISDGLYTIETALDEQKLLEISGGSQANGGNLQIWNKTNSKAQEFNITYLNNGFYKIQVEHSKKVLDVSNASKAAGANVQQYESNSSDAQQWVIKDDGDGYYSIISRCNELYLGISGSNANNGTNVAVYDNNSTTQKFKFKEIEQFKGTQTISDGLYTIEAALDEQKLLEISGSTQNNCGNLQIWNKTNSKAQQFNVTYLNNGFYKIEARHSKKVLDVDGGRKQSGTNVQQYDSNNSDAQQWVIKDEGNGYYSIISKCNELYLDISGGVANNGANVQVYIGNGSKAQRFKFNEVEILSGTQTIKDGTYKIKTSLNDKKVVDIVNSSTENGANVQIYDEYNVIRKSQRFDIKYIGDGYYKITDNNSGKVLEVEGANSFSGVNVQQNAYNNSEEQQWIIKEVGNGYYSLISRCNQLYLDIYGGYTSNGTNVQVCGSNGSDAQLFKFEEVEELKGSKTITDGIYKIGTAVNLNSFLDVSEGSLKNSANLQIWSNSNVQQQKFQIKYNENGYYEILSVNSGKSIDVNGGATKSGTNVQQFESNSSLAQQWIIEDAGNGYYYIISKLAALYLDVSGGLSSNGTNISIYDGNATNSQKFYFKTVQIMDDGNYEITIKKDLNKFLDIDAGNSEIDGANVQIWDKNNQIQQKFILEYLNDGYYKIKSKKSLKALEVQEGKTNVAQATFKATDNQKWKIEISNNGYYAIKSKSTGLYLNVHGNLSSNGTNIEVSEKSTLDSQMFKFVIINTIKGIDVSSHQGMINWMSVQRSDIDFVMIRAAYRGYGTGKIVTDTTFTRNLQNAYSSGIDVGIYFFTQAISIQEAEEEANYLINLLAPYKQFITYPVAIDTEKTKDGDGRADNISKELRTEICIRFCEKIREAGYTPMIYANKYWYMNDLEFLKLSNYDIWLAHYAEQTDFIYGYDMWQYTSSGSIDGIATSVDLNNCYKKY